MTATGDSGPSDSKSAGAKKPDNKSSDAKPSDPKPRQTATPAENPLRGSRTSGFWAAVVGLGVVLVLLIVFIAQNTRETTVTFLGWEGQAPVAVALLVAATAGLFLATAAGSLRILQLRRRVKRELS